MSNIFVYEIFSQVTTFWCSCWPITPTRGSLPGPPWSTGTWPMFAPPRPPAAEVGVKVGKRAGWRIFTKVSFQGTQSEKQREEKWIRLKQLTLPENLGGCLPLWLWKIIFVMVLLSWFVVLFYSCTWLNFINSRFLCNFRNLKLISVRSPKHYIM